MQAKHTQKHIATGEAVFFHLACSFTDKRLLNYNVHSLSELVKKNGIAALQNFEHVFLNPLTSYMLLLLYVLQFLDNAELDADDRAEHLDILRKTTPEHALLWLGYYAAMSNSGRFADLKPLIEKYAVLSLVPFLEESLAPFFLAKAFKD